MANTYNNNWTINDERNTNRNANWEAAAKDPETIAARKAREACEDLCVYPTSPENTTNKIKVWMECRADCMKKHPYTAAEKRLHGISGGKRSRRNKKNRRLTRRK